MSDNIWHIVERIDTSAVPIANPIDAYKCRGCVFVSINDLTAVSQHVVSNQFEIKSKSVTKDKRNVSSNIGNS